MQAFVAGLKAAQEAFGCHLMGGDTDRRPGPLTISITAIGSVPAGGMVRRGTARAGDFIFVSGTIGDAGLGLALSRDGALAGRLGLTADEAGYLGHRYRRPEPRLGLAAALREHASAAMDVSDGLAKDLGRLLRASSVAGNLLASDVPFSVPAGKVLAREPERLAELLTAGDDYEVLSTVGPEAAVAFAAAAGLAGIPVTRIGRIAAGAPALTVSGGDGQPLDLPARTGWDHF
jgi:thiamine-monophosphate kinase